MPVVRCPVCEGRRVAFSRSLWRGAWRAVRGSRKRRCLDCAHKWHGAAARISPRARGAALVGAVLALAAGAAWVEVTLVDYSAESALLGQWRSHYRRLIPGPARRGTDAAAP